MSIIKPSGTKFNVDNIQASRKRLASLERDDRLPSTTAQWLYWAAHGSYSKKFDQLLVILKECKNRPLSVSETGLLIDALAVGSTNITPARVEWTFKFAPRKVRHAAANHIDLNNLQDTVEEAVIGATPLDPSDKQYYDPLWRRFKSSLLKDPNAYKWSMV